MDTDSLTHMAYKTIVRAGEVLDVLRAEIGASASDKKTEDEFLWGVRAYLKRILGSAQGYLDGWNYLDTVNVKDFRRGVKELLEHVEKTLTTPYEKRGEPEF